ncbi:MAG: hypothetical protein SF051_10495 [Elusimicrobiota bacterium]|nr:hypothetical protein [Elusimicrobiota bacterium]
MRRSLTALLALLFALPASAGGKASSRAQARAPAGATAVGTVPQLGGLVASLQPSPGLTLAQPVPRPVALPTVEGLSPLTAPADAPAPAASVAPADAPASADAPAPADAPRGLARLPVVRGEVGWREAWELANPNSRRNRVGYMPKGWPRDRRTALLEAEMWSQNLAYLLGRSPETFDALDARRRREQREERRAALSAKVRAAYRLPPVEGLRLPAAALGRRLGAGSQGEAFEKEGDPRRVIKVFAGATPGQLQEMAAIHAALADAGHPVERLGLVRLPDGRLGLEMRRFAREDGWSFLDSYARARGRAASGLVERADATLRAVTAETTRAFGVDAADWKTGLDGTVDDDYLGNFAYNERTGELAAFDPVALW